MISTPISASLLALSPLNSLVMAVAGGGSCSVRIPAVILRDELLLDAADRVRLGHQLAHAGVARPARCRGPCR